jgi:hypothetical protein
MGQLTFEPSAVRFLPRDAFAVSNRDERMLAHSFVCIQFSALVASTAFVRRKVWCYCTTAHVHTNMNQFLLLSTKARSLTFRQTIDNLLRFFAEAVRAAETLQMYTLQLLCRLASFLAFEHRRHVLPVRIEPHRTVSGRIGP